MKVKKKKKKNPQVKIQRFIPEENKILKIGWKQ